MMKTINLLKLTSIALFMAFAFTACKKDKTTPKVSIDGKWVGTSTAGNLYFIIKSDTKELTYFNSDKFDPAEGTSTKTYDLTGNVIKFPYLLEGSSLTAKFDNINGKLIEGVLIDDTSGDPVSGATWSATKQQ